MGLLQKTICPNNYKTIEKEGTPSAKKNNFLFEF